MPDEHVEPKADELEAASEDEEMKPGYLPTDVTGFVISISKRLGFRRLHRLQGCNRIPGVHYINYEGPMDTLPSNDAYDASCKDCWPKKGAEEEGAGSSSSEAAPFGA